MELAAFLIGAGSFLGCYLILQRVEQDNRLQNRLEKLRIGSLRILPQNQKGGKGPLLARFKRYDFATPQKTIRAASVSFMVGALAFLYLPPLYAYAVLSVILTFGIYFSSILIKQYRYQSSIRRELPGTLDLLIICMGSGLGINAAFERVSREMGQTPLGLELRQIVNESNAGIPLEESLKNFSERAQMSEANAITGAIIQAHKSGVSLIDTLQIQASSLREKMRLGAKEKMMKIPILVLFPMVFFILPVIFIIILGPAMLSFMKVF